MKRFRREFWLWVMSVAMLRALDLCEMPDDKDMIIRLRDTAKLWAVR